MFVGFMLIFTFLSNRIIKTILYFLGGLLGCSLFVDKWCCYFIVLTYLGGLFILLIYMSTVRFSRDKIFWGGGILFLFSPFLGEFSWSSLRRISFVNFSLSEFNVIFLVFLWAIFLSLLLISCCLPSRGRAQGRV